MAGLVTTTSRNGGGSGYADGNPTFRRYTSSATIQKPFGCTIIVMECIGAGGGGGGDGGSGGGGGGAMARKSFPAESLGNSFTLTVPVGGAGAAGGGSRDGTTGGECSVEDDATGAIILRAFGGGGGHQGAGSSGGGGAGGGGGTGNAGVIGDAGSHGDGGSPLIQGTTPNQTLGG